MSTPFSIDGSLTLPPDAGQPNCPIPYSVSANFGSKVIFELDLTGSGSKSLDLGTILAPGVKGLLVEVDPDATAAPINVQFNGGGAPGQLEISPGGFNAYGSPNPVAGIVSLDIVWTTANKVRIRVLG